MDAVFDYYCSCSSLSQIKRQKGFLESSYLRFLRHSEVTISDLPVCSLYSLAVDRAHRPSTPRGFAGSIVNLELKNPQSLFVVFLLHYEKMQQSKASRDSGVFHIVGISINCNADSVPRQYFYSSHPDAAAINKLPDSSFGSRPGARRYSDCLPIVQLRKAR